jgi:hypothetical protein
VLSFLCGFYVVSLLLVEIKKDLQILCGFEALVGSVRVTRLELLWPQPLHKSWRRTLTLLLWAKLRAYERA